MIDWAIARHEYDEMLRRLADPQLDQRTRADLQRRSAQYGRALEAHATLVAYQKELAEGTELLASATDPEMRELCVAEVAQARKAVADAERDLDELLYPADEKDERSVFLEIRPAAGGLEASLFAADLYKMYMNYALAKGWQTSIVEAQTTDLGGFKEVVVHIKGRNVYRYLKHESGVHRVQRVPTTETQGRVHTSTVTVAVLPEVEDVEVNINPQDLRIDTYRSSGAGGQHVNTTDSAIRIVHLPTGLTVTCQDERSQIKNRSKALKTLQARLFEMERQKQEAALSSQRKQQVGSGERSEKIRTYNFPQNRVTDHRTDVTLKKLDMVMQGDLDDLLTPLFQWDLDQRRAKGALIGS